MNAPELVWAAVITGGLALVGVLATAFITWQKQADAKATARQVAEEVLSYLATGNGHTAGQALARLEDAAWRHEGRLDSIEVQVREARDEIDVIRKLTDAHLIEVTPMIADFKVIREERYQELLVKEKEAEE